MSGKCAVSIFGRTFCFVSFFYYLLLCIFHFYQLIDFVLETISFIVMNTIVLNYEYASITLVLTLNKLRRSYTIPIRILQRFTVHVGTIENLSINSQNIPLEFRDDIKQFDFRFTLMPFVAMSGV
jgi:hypothetical protein